MPRPSGSRNRDYDASRAALARKLASALLDSQGDPNTLKGMADAVEVSVPTLRHYFGDREAVFVAAFEAIQAENVTHLSEMVARSDDDPARALPELVVTLTIVWRRFGLGRIFAAGLILGLEHESRGPLFLTQILEPFLHAVEGLLDRLVSAGELPAIDTRGAALSLIGSVVIALLHQDNLGGLGCRPLDIESFARSHARTVLLGLQNLDGSADA